VTHYQIVGHRTVAGHQPGETVSDDELDGIDVAALLLAGHLAPIKAGKSAASAKADEAEPTKE
jgi:hypothetical protein